MRDNEREYFMISSDAKAKATACFWAGAALSFLATSVFWIGLFAWIGTQIQ